MSHLKKLTVSNRIIAAARPRHKADTIEYRRSKLIANIEEQIELVNLALEKKPLELRRKRGHDVRVVRPPLWWRVEPDGAVVTQIRYNKIPLNLGGRGTSIEVATVRKLPAAFRTVIRAVKAGELDPVIQSAARRSRR